MPHGQAGIVDRDGADADHDRVVAGAQPVREPQRGVAADPLGVAGAGGDAAIQRLGVVDGDARASRGVAVRRGVGRGPQQPVGRESLLPLLVLLRQGQ